MTVARSLWAALALALAALAVQMLLYMGQAVRFPFGLDYSEGLVIQQALWLGTDRLYGDIAHFPFLVCEYPPLYLAALRAAHAAGADILPAGRLISSAATLLACLLIGLIVFRLNRLDRPRGPAACAALIAGLLPLTLLPLMSWAPLARVDMLALALSFSGLFLGGCAFRRPALLYPAVLCFVAAVYTKQIYLSAALALLPVMLARQKGTALRAYGLGGLIGGALLGWLELRTSGRFLQHILAYTADPPNLHEALKMTGMWLLAYPVDAAVTLVAVGLIWRGFRTRARHGPIALVRDEAGAWLVFLSLYLLLTTLTLIAAGKTGASYNYFIEWMAAWCLWLGWLAGRADVPRFVPALLLLQLLPVVSGVHTLRTERFSARRLAEWGAMLQRVRGIPGPLLSDDMVLTLQAGREVLLEPNVLGELARMGLWDKQRLISRLDSHYFGAVITAYDPGDPTFDARYPGPTRDALLRDYPHVESYGDYRVRTP